MNLVDHIDLESTRGWCESRLFKQVLDLLDPPIGGGINLDVIHEASAVDCKAICAPPAWLAHNA